MHQRLQVFYFTLLYININAYTFNKHNLTREWSVKTSITNDLVSVISTNNRIIYKWISCEPDLVINLKSVEIGAISCEIPLVLEYGCFRDLATVTLGNGKIFIWIEDYNNNKSCWRHYFIESETCLYDGYRINEFSNNEVNEIVPYHNQFDVFFRNGSHCMNINYSCIMRYNDKGVNVVNFTIPYNINSTCYLKSMKVNDPTGGYIFVAVSNNETAVIKLLNQKYDEEIKNELNHTIDAISIFDKNIHFCYISSNRKQLNCKFMDSNLNLKHIVSESFPNEIVKIKMFSLIDSGLVIVTSSNYNNTFTVNSHYVKIKENFSDPVELNKYNCNTLRIEYLDVRVNVHCITSLCDNSNIITTQCITPVNKQNLVILYDKSLP